MKFKVCILAAGSGTGMGHLTTHLNKSVLPINFKAVISHIIEKFSPDVEIVVATGYKKDTVVDYLTIAHPDRTITFVEVDKFIGPGTGPGYSLLQCRPHLDCPFIFYTADTIVLEDIPEPDRNWFGIAPVKNTEPYCTVKIKNNLIYQLDDKTKNNNKFAFIGLAGVKDHQEFFESLEKNSENPTGELQVSNGFKKLLEHNLAPIGFTWFDTGTLENYQRTQKNFSKAHKFDFSKGHGDEFIFFVNNKVIKFFANEKIATDRYERGTKYLSEITPKIIDHKKNFYAYEKIDGLVLYEVLNQKLVADFLDWANTSLWKMKTLSAAEEVVFEKACQNFYHKKTNERIAAFYEKTHIKDQRVTINGTVTPPLQTLLDNLDWNSLTKGVPSNFHGDLQFDNILLTDSRDFVLLDWRQDFAGLTEFGDLYYDLAKLYGGTLISYQLIKEGMFTFDMSENDVYYSYFIKNELVEARSVLEAYIHARNLDLDKVKTITALIFINMSPLHESSFDQLLYFMGRSMLYKLTNKLA